MENRYKNEIEDLTRRYEQMRIEKEALEKRLKEVLLVKRKIGNWNFENCLGFFGSTAIKNFM
jgi:hypothetical protein